MTKYCVVWRKRLTVANFSYVYRVSNLEEETFFQLHNVLENQFSDSISGEVHLKDLY